MCSVLAITAWFLTGFQPAPQAEVPKPFAIVVKDAETGRGVPLVELTTVNNIRFVTDSNGVAAFLEPGLMDQKVFFHVKSHGYEYPKDGFGYRGKVLQTEPGGRAELTLPRINEAERLYRVTGQGIYRDSLLVGEPVPLKHPALDALVLGSDSVVNTVYQGKLRWFWGDTNRPGYPLGNFHVPGAVSLLPEDGGLDPDIGVNLDYFTDLNGFAKPTCKMPGDGPTWIGAAVVLPDKEGKDRLLTTYSKIKAPLTAYERGFAVWDDEKEEFEKVGTYPVDAPARPDGHAFIHKEKGRKYVYFSSPLPLTRVPATAESYPDISQYESYTCLKEGSTLEDPEFVRDSSVHLEYRWCKETPAVGPAEQARFENEGKLKPGEGLIALRDVETGKPVQAHSGSVEWNEYRRRWTAVFVQAGGDSSYLGEVWYAEADSPVGPWVYALKVATHDKYTFYNPKQHPYFAKDQGRIIYFEGTYASTFSGNPVQTPRYDYNQVMYRLDLDRPALRLPVAIRSPSLEQPDRFASGLEHPEWPVAFFAPDRPAPGCVPVFSKDSDGGLDLGARDETERDGHPPLFYAFPPDAKDRPKATVPLYRYQREDNKPLYSARPLTKPFKREKEPVAYVWPSPFSP